MMQLILPQRFVDQLNDCEHQGGDCSTLLDAHARARNILTGCDYINTVVVNDFTLKNFWLKDPGEDDYSTLGNKIIDSLELLLDERSGDDGYIAWTHHLKEVDKKKRKPTTGKPFSVMSLYDKTDVYTNLIFGHDGRVVFVVDFNQHGEHKPGHWHPLIPGNYDRTQGEAHAFAAEDCPLPWLAIRANEKNITYANPPCIATRHDVGTFDFPEHDDHINPSFIAKQDFMLKLGADRAKHRNEIYALKNPSLANQALQFSRSALVPIVVLLTILTFLFARLTKITNEDRLLLLDTVKKLISTGGEESTRPHQPTGDATQNAPAPRLFRQRSVNDPDAVSETTEHATKPS